MRSLQLCKRFDRNCISKHCASCRLSGKLYRALLRAQPDLTETNAQSIISKHVAGIARRKYRNHEFTFQLIDKDKRRVRPVEHHVHSSVLCTVAAALTCFAVLQVKGLNIRSMCVAARWLLQQVRLGLCFDPIAVLQQQCLRAAEPC